MFLLYSELQFQLTLNYLSDKIIILLKETNQ